MNIVPLLEIAANSLASALAAQAGGAGRVELCAQPGRRRTDAVVRRHRAGARAPAHPAVRADSPTRRRFPVRATSNSRRCSATSRPARISAATASSSARSMPTAASTSRAAAADRRSGCRRDFPSRVRSHPRPASRARRHRRARLRAHPHLWPVRYRARGRRVDSRLGRSGRTTHRRHARRRHRRGQHRCAARTDRRDGVPCFGEARARFGHAASASTAGRPARWGDAQRWRAYAAPAAGACRTEIIRGIVATPTSAMNPVSPAGHGGRPAGGDGRKRKHKQYEHSGKTDHPFPSRIESHSIYDPFRAGQQKTHRQDDQHRKTAGAERQSQGGAQEGPCATDEPCARGPADISLRYHNPSLALSHASRLGRACSFDAEHQRQHDRTASPAGAANPAAKIYLRWRPFQSEKSIFTKGQRCSHRNDADRIKRLAAAS